MKGDILIDGWF